MIMVVIVIMPMVIVMIMVMIVIVATVVMPAEIDDDCRFTVAMAVSPMTTDLDDAAADLRCLDYGMLQPLRAANRFSPRATFLSH